MNASSPSPSSSSSAASAESPSVPTTSGCSSDNVSLPLTPEERREYNELRRENQLLKAENIVLQRKLTEEKTHRLQWQQEDSHYATEAKACCELIDGLDKNAPVLALYEELHRLRTKCDVYADAIEESRSYFFEMKRLYTEVEPILRSSGLQRSPSHAQPEGR